MPTLFSNGDSSVQQKSDVATDASQRSEDVCNENVSLESARPVWRDEMQLLGARYAAQLPARIGKIEAIWCALEKKFAQDESDESEFAPDRVLDSANTTSPDESEISFFELYRLVHNLSGSGTIYGFPTLSEAAHQLEVLLLPLTESAHGWSSLSLLAHAQIEVLLAHLKRAAQCDPKF